jgi:hypothetical protein
MTKIHRPSGQGDIPSPDATPRPRVYNSRERATSNRQSFCVDQIAERLRAESSRSRTRQRNREGHEKVGRVIESERLDHNVIVAFDQSCYSLEPGDIVWWGPQVTQRRSIKSELCYGCAKVTPAQDFAEISRKSCNVIECHTGEYFWCHPAKCAARETKRLQIPDIVEICHNEPYQFPWQFIKISHSGSEGRVKTEQSSINRSEGLGTPRTEKAHKKDA